MAGDSQACVMLDRVVAELVEIGLEGRFDKAPDKALVHEEPQESRKRIGDGKADDAGLFAIVKADGPPVGQAIDGFPLNNLVANQFDNPRLPVELKAADLEFPVGEFGIGGIDLNGFEPFHPLRQTL